MTEIWAEYGAIGVIVFLFVGQIMFLQKTLMKKLHETDEKVIALGELHLKCFYVPGHSQDHLVFYEAALGILLTGDLLFVGKVGGTDSDDNARSEWESLQRLLRLLPDQTTIWPGHDYGVRPSSTMDLEKRTNPFLRCADADAFLRFKSEWPRFKSELGLK